MKPRAGRGSRAGSGPSLTCDLLLVGERGPGALLLLLQGLLLRGQLLHAADLRQGVLPPVEVARHGVRVHLGHSCTEEKTQGLRLG